MDWKTTERAARRLLGRLPARFAGVSAGASGSVRLDEVRRILFVRPNFRLGNLLLATPAPAGARRALPGAEIHLLAPPTYAGLVRDLPSIDRVAPYERGVLLQPSKLVRLIRRIRHTRYDLLVDCSDGESATGALLARVSGARWRVAPTPSRYEGLYDVRVPRDPHEPHVIERLAAVMEGIGIPCPRSMEAAPGERARAWAEARWREWGLTRPVVGVNVGARGEKRWPVSSFLEVVRRLVVDRETPVIVFAGPQDLDRLAAMEGRLPDGVVVSTTDRVRRFAALLERCAVLVTGDTGPMHLAAALGTPTVSVFLRGDHATFAPLGPRHRCLHDEAGVRPVAVLDAVTDVLQEAVSRAPARAGTRPRS